MVINLLRKEKNRIYKSEDIVKFLSGLTLYHDEKGRPFVDSGYISITDTKNYWACAFSDNPLGIDMEETDRKISGSSVRSFHKKEKEYLSVLSQGSSEWKEEFLRIWTRKESYVKYLGEGLSYSFSSFCVLDDCSENIQCRLYDLVTGKLVIAATDEIQLKKFSYDAPMKKTALEAGADLLDISGFSSNTLKEKLLQKGYSEEDSNQAVDLLLERGFLNDEEYSRSLCQKYESKSYSSRRMEMELKRKGVPSEIASEYALKYRDEDYARAVSIAEKMAEGKTMDDKLKAKICRKLSSLGYDTNRIYDIIHKL